MSSSLQTRKAAPAVTGAQRSPSQQHEKVLILDFGAQYTQLIARRVREAKVYCEIHPWDVSDAFVQDAACPIGQVRKVTGAIRGLNRKRICVTLASEQASLVSAIP